MKILRLMLLMMALGSQCYAQEVAGDADSSPDKETAPPRSVADIDRLLSQFKPNQALIEKKKASADEQAPQTADRQTLFEFYVNRAHAAGKIGRIDQQLADLKQAVEYGEKGTVANGRNLRKLAQAEADGGYLVSAARTARAAIAEIPTTNGTELLRAYRTWIYINALRGSFKNANAGLIEAEAHVQKLQQGKNLEKFEHEWTALIEFARAEVLQTNGELKKAEAAYRKALDEHALARQDRLARSAKGKLGAAYQETWHQDREVMQRRLATVLLAEGLVIPAEIYARFALNNALKRVGRDSTDAALGMSLLGKVLSEQGRAREATHLAELALQSYQFAGVVNDGPTMTNARKLLASSLVDQGRYAEGIAAFELNRDALKNNNKIQPAALDWVLAMIKTGDVDGALKMARQLSNGAKKKYGDGDERTIVPNAFLAMALVEKGKKVEALDLFKETVPALIDHAQPAEDGDSGSDKQARYLKVILESYLKLLAEIAKQSDSRGAEAIAESFRMADVARSSSVQKALTASAARANFRDPRLAELARREQDGQAQLKSLSDLLSQLLSLPPEEREANALADVQKDIARLKEQRTALRREITDRYPEYAALVDPKPSTIAATQQVLKSGEALVTFYFAEDQGYVWALQAGRPAVFSTVPMTREQLAQQVVHLRLALDPGATTLAEIPPFDVTSAYKLYSLLLKPVESGWKGARVLLTVPHAALGQLPLALLPTAEVSMPGKTAIPFEGYKTVPWLERQVAVAQLPSVTALPSLRRLPPGNLQRRSFIGFGDPLFSKEQAKEAGVAVVEASPKVQEIGVRSSAKTEKLDSASLASLPRLPDTNQEIREIGKVLGASANEDIFLQTQVTEKRILATDLSNRRVVMFSTHGLVSGDIDGLSQPALALTSPEVVPDSGEGLLTLEKALTLKLNADWVVLSACNTAAGDGAGSEALSGLGRGFFYAGARALLASNWPVDTVAARKIMTELFQYQKSQPAASKAEALRYSILSLIDGPGSLNPKTGSADFSYAHPMFWAPFVVVGD